MSSVPSTSTRTTTHSNFVSVFNAALETYKHKTKNDLVSHPLLPTLQSCNSPEAILTVLREQIPAFGPSRNGDDRLTKWVNPTVNVLYSFSTTLGGAVGLAFPPASIIFAGIGVLLSAAEDASAGQDKLIELFNRIERLFCRLEIYTSITPTAAMTDMMIEIMVEVLTILAIATKELKRGRLKKYIKKMTGNTDIEDSLERLDKLTLEEVQMASAELLKMAHSIDDKVMNVDDTVKGIGGKVQDVHGDVQYVRSDTQDVGNKVRDVDDRVQGIANDVKDMSSEVRGVDDKLDQVNRNQLRDNLLRWLSPPDPSVNHNTTSKSHHDGTAEWFLQGSTFNQWKSTDPFLWVHGKPGSGKSVICSSIIQDIKASCDTGRASMAYFYFDFRDVDKQKLHKLLLSLLIQLSAQSDSSCDILYELYSSNQRGVRQPDDRAMVKCLKDMLTLEAQGPTYIIMDALDECPISSTVPSPREEVLDFVDELVGLHLPHVHICVTSRPAHDIQAVLKHLPLRAVSLHDETGQQQDISDYVHSFVQSDRRMQRWREEDRDLVIKTLSEKADGMFRWVFCQLEILRHCFPSSVRHILEDLPESLDETYERILREIRKPNQGHAHRMLQCLVAAVRPLRVKELAEVLAVDFVAEGVPKLNVGWRWEDQEEAVMLACSSMVIIVEDGGSRIVQFSHFSVKEYLTVNRLAEPIRDISRYHIRPEAAHTIFGQACLGVLLGLDDRVDRDNIENFPLARYAAQYWPTHARFENASSRLKDGMECLFDEDESYFATWLWIYNEDQHRSLSTLSPEEPEAVPLYYAAMLGFRHLAEHLIAEHPEHVNARGGSQETPMHVAALAGQTDILSLLLEHGVDVDCRETFGQTPLHSASWLGEVEAGQFLLDHGADIDGQDDNDWTPLFSAAIKGQVEFARMLLERGAAIDARNTSGETALHQGVMGGNIQTVRLLVEHGADVDARDESGKTPSDLGSEWGQDDIVELLLSDYGARPVLPFGLGFMDLLTGYGTESVESLSEYGTESVELRSEYDTESVE